MTGAGEVHRDSTRVPVDVDASALAAIVQEASTVALTPKLALWAPACAVAGVKMAKPVKAIMNGRFHRVLAVVPSQI